MAVRAPMRKRNSNVHAIIRQKREWHTPADAQSLKQGFRGWHSRGYLPHFDVPGVIQMVNYRLGDAMPMSHKHEWAELLEIEDDLKRCQKVEE